MIPDSWTLAELLDLADRKIRYDWTQTSALLATILNVNRTSGEPVALDAFVPKTQKEIEDERKERENTLENQTEKEEFLNFLKNTYNQNGS